MDYGENCRLLPVVKNQEILAKYYSLGDVFVICSKKENFPTTCLEAQCCGTPVAGFDTGGTKETSVTKEDSFVEYGDIDSLKEKVETILHKDYSDLAETAQSQYSNEHMVREYMKVYDREGRKERVLLIDVNCKFSSTGKIVYNLFKGLKKDGREAAICYGRGDEILEDGIYKFGLDWETNIHAGLARITGYNGCFSSISTRRLIAYIEKFKPDVIHIHELHAYFVNIKPLLEYIKKKKIKVVWTFHCEYMYTGKCGHAYSCTNFMHGCGKCPAVHEYPKSLFIDRTKQMFSMKRKAMNGLDVEIVTPSEWLAKRVKMSFLQNVKISIIHNGIDTNIFKEQDTKSVRNELKISSENKVVLAVAPDIMSESKGGKWVLKLAESMKDKPITFILIGVQN
ncbi:glycosyltransferase [Dorea formicigenerans]|jgi:glycosyltransferase involved in cell wall biosynthesis|uniref:glycosyltransferase n=1 Tax=Dorea formicigenerans TaxID=39486 RepID=UPI00156FBCBD|nr:glycosyltransferase [Dorea formicigenerans]NSK21168.1 glycosyltransferase [Dorea formicigenerans]